ncbi:hypothetical protein ACFE04_016568 [Oxalis oulophora]
MARRKIPIATKAAAAASAAAAAAPDEKGKKKQQRLKSGAERSAFFARREAAKVLKCILQGDASRRAVGSIKTLVFSPSVRNKKATFALVCQTLKYISIIKDVLEPSKILNAKWKRQEELMYIIAYDILFGQEISSEGDAEKFLMQRKDALQSAMAKLMVKKQVKRVEDLVSLYHIPVEDISKPRYVRVNTLKMDVDSAMLELGKRFKVEKDDMLEDLLVLPPGSDLHNNPLVMSGSVFLQGKASSMVAAALAPEPEWEVLDACSAPGNKTIHLAALMGGKGKVTACELNRDRVKRLEDTIRLSGAASILTITCLSIWNYLFSQRRLQMIIGDLSLIRLIDIKVLHGDFLKLNPKDPEYAKVRAILLDPSCSGSGTASERLDHLLPSHAGGPGMDFAELERLNKLASFQRKALEHALSFPAVEKVVYSTCSIHQIENEDVVNSILPFAASNGFQLATPFPQWPRRGLPVFEGSENLLRTDPVEDKEGFFIALFVRRGATDDLPVADHKLPEAQVTEINLRKLRRGKQRKLRSPSARIKIFKLWLH